MDKVAVDIQIARIMEQQAQCVVTPKNYTEEEKKLKQSILSQYAQVFFFQIVLSALILSVVNYF